MLLWAVFMKVRTMVTVDPKGVPPQIEEV